MEVDELTFPTIECGCHIETAPVTLLKDESLTQELEKVLGEEQAAFVPSEIGRSISHLAIAAKVASS